MKLAGVLVLTASLLTAASGRAVAQKVVFAPPDNLPRGAKPANAPDFPKLFSQPAEWRNGLEHISRFGLNSYYAARAPEKQLADAVDFLARRRIALAVALQVLPAQRCGRGVEGIVASPRQPVGTARRLKRLGAKVAYFGLDEPLTFGHFYRRRRACGFSVQEVARRVAQSIAGLRAVFPGVKISDTEAPGRTPPAVWLSALNEWLSAYRTATGTPLDAFVLDLNWRNPNWRPIAARTLQILRAHHVSAGIIIDAAGGPRVTDASWMAEARRNALSLARSGLRFDDVVISSWTGHPRRMLPETDPEALTSLIDWWDTVNARK